jgi:hypothetical protein
MKNILLVNTNKSLKSGKTPIESASGNWLINKDKACNIQYVVAVEKNNIVECFEVTSFSSIGDRVRFNLIPTNKLDINVGKTNYTTKYI